MYSFSVSIHSDLQTVSHTPQLIHVSLLTTILNSENFDRNPKKAPTGQRVLQKNLPFLYEKSTTINRTVSAKTTAKISALLKVDGDTE